MMTETLVAEELLRSKKQRIELASCQQRKASDPHRSVWVEASAGTGKTKVLSDRVLRLLLDGVAPGRILCLTYTKAAAVEMNTRIAGRLSRWAVIEEDVLEQELQKLLGVSEVEIHKNDALKAQARKLFAVLLDTPGGMKIQTIHSFCQEILKRFPIEAKISPYFEVMDDRSAQEAIDDIKKKLLLKIENQPEDKTAQALAFLTKNVSEFSFPKIMNSLTENRNKISKLLEQYSSLDDLIAAIACRLHVREDETVDEVLQNFVKGVDYELLGKLILSLQQGSDTDQKKANLLAEIKEKGLGFENYEKYRGFFLTSDGELRKSVASQKGLKLFPEILEWIPQEGERIMECEHRKTVVHLFAATRAVLYLANDLIQGYMNYKRLHSKTDYEDLIVLTRNLLENPQVASWVLYKLDGGIDNILIDEAQDTSPDQWAIIKAVSDEFFNGEGGKDRQSTVFAVGDRKQSIYSFQGADPQEFEKMRHYFAQKISEVADFDEVNLDVSFRSTAAILDVVNCIFADEKVKKGVALEGQSVFHTPSRIGEGGKVELWPLVEAKEGENPDVWLPPVERKPVESTSSRLAEKIALKIKEMVKGGERLVSQNRKLHYKDFMILVQRRNSFVEELVRACKNVGVSVAGVDKIQLLEQIAVQDLVSLGKFLLLPSDDLSLAEVLKSPLFGLTDDDLFKLCYLRGKAPLWSKLGDFEAYAEVYKQLQDLLNRADFVRPFELYSYLLNKLGGRKKFVARIGYEAEDGLDEFLNLCLDFEREHLPSLQLFIDWIGKDEVEIKRELEQSDADAVRIMTVHGSKGLQAPIVILPDMVRVKNIRNEAGLLLDDLMYYPLSSSDYDENCKKIKQREKELSLEEYRRLLYVALTRAEERLCLCGYMQKNKPSDESWYMLCRNNLEKIASKQDDGTLVYEVKQQVKPQEQKSSEPQKAESFSFDWVEKNAPEEGPLARPLAPSKLDEEEDVPLMSPIDGKGQGHYRRGQLIHKLLQFLPSAEGKQEEATLRTFLHKNAPDLADYEENRITKEVLSLLKQENFQAIFSHNSRAEVPLMGMVNGRIISGQIDRLIVEKERVMIVDFKTNRPAAKHLAEVPKAYLKQLNAYKELVQKIYPDKKIETYILWTDTAVLMLIE